VVVVFFISRRTRADIVAAPGVQARQAAMDDGEESVGWDEGASAQMLRRD
jgi:hypothetical protein